MSDIERRRRPFLPVFLPAVVCLAAGAGCHSSYGLLGDEEPSDGFAGEDGAAVDALMDVEPDGDVRLDADSSGDVEAGPDVAAEADTDVAAEADADVGTDAAVDASDDTPVVCSDGWIDPASGRCWQESSVESRVDWSAAADYCENLSADGLPVGSWRLPTISELRSLIRGCPDTMTGGACRVTDSCLGRTCTSAACSSCDYLGGPAADGCYWDPALEGFCTWYWSSSSYAGASSYAWAVDFVDGSVFSVNKTNRRSVRCVRAEP